MLPMTQERARFQFRLRTIFVITTIVAIVVAAYIAWDRAQRQFFHAMFVGNTGPVRSRDDWPEPLKAILAEAKDDDLNEATIQVYCLCQGFDPEFVWRMDAAPDLLEHLKQRWKLTQVSHPNCKVLKGHSHNSGIATPPWWSPKDDDDTTFFVCPQTLAGRKGDRFLVALDARRNAIFVHYWFNF
jgi:hypothetical protein